MDGKLKYSVGKTSAQPNHIVHVRLTKKVQLFILFWVDEYDNARTFFEKASQTRSIILKTSKDYDPMIHKIHLVALQRFSHIQQHIDNLTDKYGGERKAEVKEVSFFSHSGVDGPIIYQSIMHTPLEMLIVGHHRNQMKAEYWGKINCYWAANARLNFFGCNSGKIEGSKNFAQILSRFSNYKNVTVGGQSSSSFPSFYPDSRQTSVARSVNLGWDIGPTYMVAGIKNDGNNALKGQGTAKEMNFYKNGDLLYKNYQSIFNDHRSERSNIQSDEHKELEIWKRNGYIK